MLFCKKQKIQQKLPKSRDWNLTVYRQYLERVKRVIKPLRESDLRSRSECRLGGILGLSQCRVVKYVFLFVIWTLDWVKLDDDYMETVYIYPETYLNNKEWKEDR